ncbi:MAG TPA: DUF3662 domain-containing protein, partial [Firmicutes bacterium]|nr:DUF3662 domain-containing protein [Bacillota bacterium]
MNRFGRLWTRLRSAWVRRRAARRRNRLPEVLRLHLVAALEESGRGREARANHFRIELDPVDAAALAPSTALPIELAREVAAEARRRGYALAGPVRVEIVAGPGPGIHVQARREP